MLIFQPFKRIQALQIWIFFLYEELQKCYCGQILEFKLTADVYPDGVFCDVCGNQIGKYIYHCAAHDYDKCVMCI